MAGPTRNRENDRLAVIALAYLGAAFHPHEIGRIFNALKGMETSEIVAHTKTLSPAAGVRAGLILQSRRTTEADANNVSAAYYTAGIKADGRLYLPPQDLPPAKEDMPWYEKLWDGADDWFNGLGDDYSEDSPVLTPELSSYDAAFENDVYNEATRVSK